MLAEDLQAIVTKKELKSFVCHDVILEVVVVLVVLVVARCPELCKLSRNRLCLVAVEEEMIVAVLYPLGGFVRQYSYTGGAREYAKVPRRLMIFGKPRV